jgi:triosephosphate isomerase
MSSRTPLIAGNWKMNGSLAASEKLVAALRAGVGEATHAEMLVCPPFTYLDRARQWLAGSKIELGAQDVCADPGAGAFTGEVSGEMLVDVGCHYAIVGHSERRTFYGETDAVVIRKLEAAQAADLVPILCVGESLAEREAGRTEAVVGRQIQAVVDALGAAVLAHAVVAYEPIWAIGTGRTASPEQAQEVHAFIRALVADRDATMAGQLRILYGGSVKGANAAELFAQEDIDGGLVGGASLDAKDFLAIFQAAAA